ncbi:MAG: prepilin peptidase [Candidatus Binatia bacterium]
MAEKLFFNTFLVLFTSLAAGFDIREKRIPNWLILVGLIFGLLINALKGRAQLMDSVWGLFLGLGIFVIPFALGWLGAGDVKLFGVLGAILGVKWLPRVFFYSAILGGLLALFSIIYQRGVRLKGGKEMWTDFKVLIMSRGSILPEGRKKGREEEVDAVPYGVALGLGALFAFYVDPQGGWAGF